MTQASVSLDGYISKPDNTIGVLFDWLQNGDVEITSPAGDIVFRLTPASADYWRGFMAQLGALIVGRTLFDLVDGWNGRYTLDVPVVVVTHRIPASWVEAHPDAPFTFVTDGIESAVEQAKLWLATAPSSPAQAPSHRSACSSACSTRSSSTSSPSSWAKVARSSRGWLRTRFRSATRRPASAAGTSRTSPSP